MADKKRAEQKRKSEEGLERRRAKTSQSNDVPEALERRRANTRRNGSRIIEIEEAQKRRQEKRAEQVKQEKVQRRREKLQARANRPKMSRSKKMMICGILLIAALIFFYNGYHAIDLNLNKNVYEKKYEEKLAEKTRLEKELSLVDDPQYVEQQARDRFHMLRDGEILYVFPEKEAVEAQ